MNKENTEEENQFFWVIIGANDPRKRFVAKGLAVSVAKKMAKQYPGQEFYVAKVTHRVLKEEGAEKPVETFPLYVEPPKGAKIPPELKSIKPK